MMIYLNNLSYFRNIWLACVHTKTIPKLFIYVYVDKCMPFERLYKLKCFMLYHFEHCWILLVYVFTMIKSTQQTSSWKFILHKICKKKQGCLPPDALVEIVFLHVGC